MKPPLPPSFRELFDLIGELTRTLRCCQQEESFCLDLTLGQFFILHALSGKREIPLTELHSLLSVEKSTTTRMVGPLLRRGLVLRKKSEADGRALNLSPTPREEETYGRIWVCLAEFLGAIRKRIPAAERKRTYRATRTFLRAIQEASKARGKPKKRVKGERNVCCQGSARR